MWLNGRDVYYLDLISYSYDNSIQTKTRWNSWYPETFQRFYFRNPVVLLYTKKEVEDSIKSKTVDVKTVTKLYFDSASSYPRFKIKDTNYKRCIKYEKCDAVVIPDNISVEYSVYSYTIFYSEENDCFYAIKDTWKPEQNKTYKEIESFGNGDFIDGLKVLNILPKNCKETYKGTISICDNNMMDTIENIISKYAKIVSDSELDKVVNATFEDITEETIISLDDMLQSTDKTTVELGKKVLQGLNVTKTPISIAILLATNYPNICGNKAMTSTGVSQVLSSLGTKFSGYVRTSNPITSIKWITKDSLENASNEDRKMTMLLIQRYVYRRMLTEAKAITNTIDNIPISIRINVE